MAQIFAGSQDSTIKTWNAESGEPTSMFLNGTDEKWLVVSPDSRFDTNNLEEIKSLYWVMPDDPLHALPVEIFMRDYYEPSSYRGCWRRTDQSARVRAKRRSSRFEICKISTERSREFSGLE